MRVQTAHPESLLSVEHGEPAEAHLENPLLQIWHMCFFSSDGGILPVFCCPAAEDVDATGSSGSRGLYGMVAICGDVFG